MKIDNDLRRSHTIEDSSNANGKVMAMKRPIIAIVDDEQDLRDNFQSLLEDQFEIKAFASPQEFLQALPDLQQKGLRLQAGL